MWTFPVWENIKFYCKEDELYWRMESFEEDDETFERNGLVCVCVVYYLCGGEIETR